MLSPDIVRIDLIMYHWLLDYGEGIFVSNWDLIPQGFSILHPGKSGLVSRRCLSSFYEAAE